MFLINPVTIDPGGSSSRHQQETECPAQQIGAPEIMNAYFSSATPNVVTQLNWKSKRAAKLWFPLPQSEFA